MQEVGHDLSSESVFSLDEFIADIGEMNGLLVVELGENAVDLLGLLKAGAKSAARFVPARENGKQKNLCRNEFSENG